LPDRVAGPGAGVWIASAGPSPAQLMPDLLSPVMSQRAARAGDAHPCPRGSLEHVGSVREGLLGGTD